MIKDLPLEDYRNGLLLVYMGNIFRGIYIQGYYLQGGIYMYGGVPSQGDIYMYIGWREALRVK